MRLSIFLLDIEQRLRKFDSSLPIKESARVYILGELTSFKQSIKVLIDDQHRLITELVRDIAGEQCNGEIRKAVNEFLQPDPQLPYTEDSALENLLQKYAVPGLGLAEAKEAIIQFHSTVSARDGVLQTHLRMAVWYEESNRRLKRQYP